MKNSLIIFAFASSIALSSCGESTTSENASPTTEAPKQEQPNPAATSNTTAPAPAVEQPVELPWNFKGTIGNIPIKAQLNFQEATNNEFTGAVSFPISGYYYYESQNIKIPLEGDANGVGMLWLSAGDETFDGEVVGEAMLENFSGTWAKGKKKLRFVLNSK
jgi:hypothetical protein